MKFFLVALLVTGSLSLTACDGANKNKQQKLIRNGQDKCIESSTLNSTCPPEGDNVQPLSSK